MSTFGRRPGLRHLDVALGAPGRRNVVVSAAGRGRPAKKAAAPTAADGDAPPPPRRLARILERYENPEDQETEALLLTTSRAAAAAEAPKTRDGRPPRRAARAAKFAAGGEELAAKRAAMFTINPATGEPSPVVGYYGGGRPQWWALRVNPGREKQVIDAIERLLPQLPPVEGSDEPRSAECWAPAKKIRAWSPKTGRMGAKAMKYEDGGWLMVRTVLDSEFSRMLSGNINVLGFRDREVFQGAEFPRPATPELMKTLKEWEEDLRDLGEADVKAMVPGLVGERLPAVSSATEEFFFDEDAEELDRRIAERGERGERGGRGRGRRGGRDAGRGRGGRGRGFYGSDDDDRPRARRENRGRDRDSAGSGWYAGGTAAADADAGWYTGGAAGSSGSVDSFDFGEEGDFSGAGWFAGRTSDAEDIPTIGGVGTGSGGGLLTDDDLEFWGAGSGAAAVGSGDDLDAVWGAGSDSDSGAFGGWLPLDEPGLEVDERARGGGRGRGREDRGRGRGREERGREGRGRGRDEWAPRGARDDRGPRSRRDDDGGERYSAPAWGADDLSWWDNPAGGGDAAASSAGSAGAPDFDDFAPSTKSSAKGKGMRKDAAPAAEVDDWFGGDAAGAWEDFGADFGGGDFSGNSAGSAESSLPAGTPIEVVSGRFADFEGVVVEDAGGGRVKAELDVFGTPTVVEVSRGEVESLED